MKKCILYIHLMDFPSSGYCNSKRQMNGIHLCYWRECLIVVYVMNLLKTFGNQSFLVSDNMSIHYVIGPIDSSASDKLPL
jgi:hypothetical protein